MTRRRFLAALQLPPRPNILFILADDLGWGDLSCYGNRQIKTPHLDRLAAQGSLFTQFYVCGSVCSPSRTAFTTGQFPARHRIHGHLATEADNLRRGMPNFLDPAVPTLARPLQQSGYATAHFGKWHLGRFTGAPLPTVYGFDVQRSIASNDDRQEEMAKGYRAQSPRLIVDDCLRLLDALPATKPFYLQVWMLLPHAPLDPTEEQLSEFAGQAPHPTTVTQRGATKPTLPPSAISTTNSAASSLNSTGATSPKTRSFSSPPTTVPKIFISATPPRPPSAPRAPCAVANAASTTEASASLSSPVGPAKSLPRASPPRSSARPISSPPSPNSRTSLTPPTSTAKTAPPSSSGPTLPAAIPASGSGASTSPATPPIAAPFSPSATAIGNSS